MKKIGIILLALIMLVSARIPVLAAESEEIITYTVYDVDGNIVDEGSIPPNARATWTGITLASGSTATFKNGSNAFIKYSGASMKFSYSLSSSATMTTRIMKTSTATGSGSNWSTTTKTASSGTITKTADETAYYYPRITNSSTSYITITSASFI